MQSNIGKIIMKDITIGIVAHVDAGKTTLSEAILYNSGKIRKIGRVDWRNTYLDTHSIEKDRGITVFSKQAVFEYGNTRFTLIDTPGHTDFTSETERSISILDYAILVISGSESVQSHTEEIWEMLERYSVPTFVFVTKMDSSLLEKSSILTDLNKRLSNGILEMDGSPDTLEKIAVNKESTLDRYLESGTVDTADINEFIKERKIFPCYFGSGLKNEGITELLDALDVHTMPDNYGDDFSAKVYKIEHDGPSRITFLKVTGGDLKIRQEISYVSHMSDAPLEEKITAIRYYSGAKFEQADSCPAGRVCAVTGLSGSYAGMHIGRDDETATSVFEPVMHYSIKLRPGEDARAAFQKLKLLEEEDPMLRLVWNERFHEINVQITGQIQKEVLAIIAKERFGLSIEFGQGKINYKETIKRPAVGIGHFEPLRHYAEVHVLIEPAESGTGITVETAVSENALSRNWQRLIVSCLEEKRHRGVLTGSPLTDVKITLIAGRAHLKHTQGGDFREACTRAVRQALMKLKATGQCTLLEPYFSFTLEVPQEFLGRAMSELVAAYAKFRNDGNYEEYTIIKGIIPVSSVNNFTEQLSEFSSGRSRFSCRYEGYFPCHDAETIISEIAYDPESDLSNPPHSVFCSHGSGFVVPWNEVQNYSHLTSDGIFKSSQSSEVKVRHNINIDEKELEAIMEREFGPIKRRIYGKTTSLTSPDVKNRRFRKSMYLIDGYNVIFASEELSEIAERDLEQARKNLCDILLNYKAFTGKEIVVVFDAYNVSGAVERKIDYNGLNVVFTKENELADTYIERFIYTIGKDYSVRVVTSDGLIQLQALRTGILRMSSREFWQEIVSVDEEIEKVLLNLKKT